MLDAYVDVRASWLYLWRMDGGYTYRKNLSPTTSHRCFASELKMLPALANDMVKQHVGSDWLMAWLAWPICGQERNQNALCGQTLFVPERTFLNNVGLVIDANARINLRGRFP